MPTCRKTREQQNWNANAKEKPQNKTIGHSKPHTFFQTTRLSENALINLCGEKHSNLQQHPNKSNGGVVRGQAGCGEIGLWLPSPAHGDLSLELVVTAVQEFPSWRWGGPGVSRAAYCPDDLEELDVTPCQSAHSGDVPVWQTHCTLRCRPRRSEWPSPMSTLHPRGPSKEKDHW